MRRSNALDSGRRGGEVIGRRLALGFGAVSLVAILMGATLVLLLGRVAGSVHTMQRDETAIQESLALSTAVRELFIHQAHLLLSGNTEHISHYDQYRQSVLSAIKALRPLVPKDEADRVKRVSAATQELDDLFEKHLRPAAARGDREALARFHRRAEELVQTTTTEADAIARIVERRMAGAHTSATHYARAGLLAGTLCMVLVVLLSVAFTRHLRRAVLRPLHVLSAAADRLGAGDFRSRVGPVGEGEMGQVAEAFDRMADEVEEREKRLIESERMAAIGQLAAGVAHEINNPIHVIRGYLKTMGAETTPEELVAELAILDEEAAACQRIAEDLVAYSRIPEIDLSPVELDQLVADTVARFLETPEGSGREVTVDVSPGTLHADTGRLRQVLLNLLNNAAQAAPAEEPIHVEGTVAPDGATEIRVLDRGKGVALEDQPRVFEPFFTKRSGGSGLGLAVCQGIIRAHGGNIRVEDRPGGGAAFRVVLPTRGEAGHG